MMRRVKLSEDQLSLRVTFNNGRKYIIERSFLFEKIHIPTTSQIIEIGLDLNGAELFVKCLDHKTYRIPWDVILHHLEPAYEHFIGKQQS